jgi:hypothetical protein
VSILPRPDMEQARSTAGVLCHFIASDPAMTEAFRSWVEHHPGDLTTADVTSYLSGVHDLISPECTTPAGTDLQPNRRPRPELRVVADEMQVLAKLAADSNDAVVAAWVRDRAPTIRQAFLDAEDHRREHRLPAHDDRQFGQLAEEFSEMVVIE